MHSSTLPPLVRRFSLLKAAYVVSLVITDLVMVRLAFLLAYYLRLLGDPGAAERIDPLPDYDKLAVLYAAVMVGTFAARHMYIPRRGVTRVDLLYQVAGAVAIGWILCLAATLLIFRALDPPRLMLIYWALLSVLLVWVGRIPLDAVLRQARRRGRDRERVLIVGAGDQAELVYSKIREAPDLGYRVVGFIGDAAVADGLARVQPILGGLEDVADVVRRHGIGEVIIASPGISHPQLVDIVTGCTREQVNIKIFPDIFELMAREVETSELTGLPLMRVRDVALRGWARVVKRAMDVALAWTLLVFLSPLMLFTAFLVKLTSPAGPVLYVQERVGLDGRPFHMIKFRSMRPDAEVETGPVWAAPDDERRTSFGGFMRRFSLDEMPQLINVFLGEMSLVGPRPERPEFVALFERFVPRYQERHREKAGVTGWAQVNGLRGQSSIEERTKYDLFYVENWSLAFDLKVLLKTIGAIFRARNAY
jgi:exopolysaccharide biosynthesis polyprenyl glycosylphosphotransferase